MVLNYQVLLTYTAESLSLGLAMHMYQTILALFLLSDHIVFFTWPNLDPIYHKTMWNEAIQSTFCFCELTKVKDHSTYSSYYAQLTYSCRNNSIPSNTYCVTKLTNENLSPTSTDCSFNSTPGQSSINAFWLAFIKHLNLSPCFSLPLLPLYLLYTQYFSTCRGWNRYLYLSWKLQRKFPFCSPTFWSL